jgi:hypothetical protein
MRYITSIDWCIFKSPLHPRSKPFSVMVYDPFNVLLNSVC